ncbi:tRNA uracil 4-sulfurtransferase ThiI [Deltaproteobacteria bacterium TL4]
MTQFIVRYSEIGIKGKNRKLFEKCLQNNIRTHLKPYGLQKVARLRGRLVVQMEGNDELALKILKRIPGIANISPGFYTDLSMKSLIAQSQQLVQNQLTLFGQESIPFRVTAHRTNKRFSMTSADIQIQLGAELLTLFPQLKVNLSQPLLDVGVEIWDSNGIVYVAKHRGIGGLPVNPRQKVISLISGGIDSPVASWMIMKRGCQVVYLHFHSFPFIGEQSKEKVLDLVRLLAHTQPYSKVYIAPFAELQKAIRDQCPEPFRTLLYRRAMNLIANQIAELEQAKALITGDCLSQVASQTLHNLVNTTENATIPILRPLIGMDKNEIVLLARHIGTYDLSIQNFPDCCTVFQPQAPATNARLTDLLKAEEKLENLDTLVSQSVEQCEVYNFSCSDATML